jgi:hypothetical protein
MKGIYKTWFPPPIKRTSDGVWEQDAENTGALEAEISKNYRKPNGEYQNLYSTIII